MGHRKRLKRLTVVLACAACSSPSARPDAPPPTDAFADAAPDGPPPVGPVTLTSLYYDARVFFQAHDGSLIDVKNVSANSSVTVDVPLGSNVTAVVTDGGGRPGYDMFSFLHVHPDDHLYVYVDGVYAHTTPTLEVTPDPDPDVTGYLVKLPLPCGGQITQVVDTSTTKQLVTDLFCPTPSLGTTTDVIVRSKDSSGVPQNFIYAPDVVLANTTHVDLTAASWSPPTSRTVTILDMPASAVYRVVLRVLGPHGVLDLASSQYAQNGTGTISAFMIPNTIDWYTVFWGDDATGSFRNTHFWNGSAAVFANSVASHILPTVGPATYSGATGTVTWTETGVSNVSPNWSYVVLRATSGLRRGWYVMGPHNGTSITLPRLPIETDDLSISDADGASFSYVEIGNIPGGHQAAPLTPYWGLTVLAPPVTGPSSGILETSTWFAP